MIANLIRTLIIEPLKEIKMTIQDIQSFAEAHVYLLLTDKMNFNEMGIDFKVVFALDNKGNNGYKYSSS